MLGTPYICITFFNKALMKKICLFLLMASSSLMMMVARPRTQAEIQLAAQSVLSQQRGGTANHAPNAFELKEKLRTEAVTVLGFSETDGFVIVANDDLLPAVLAVGDSKFVGSENLNFKWWLDAIEAISSEISSGATAPLCRVPAPDPSVYPLRVDPIVTSKWDQSSPYWNQCPTKGNSRCLTGCVATAIAQVFYSNQYPTTGVGSHTNTSASTVTAYFGETTYDYALMQDTYSYGYSEESADAVATLMLHCGVAVDMNYSPSGSGAYSNKAASGIRQYFGIPTAKLHDREDYSDEEWMDMIYSELAGGHAMYYSGIDANGEGGHAFVCDGYDETGRVHINWGWSGSCDGYYNIDLLNPSYYQFNMMQDIILGMYNPDAAMSGTKVNKTVEVDVPGTLSALIPDSVYSCISGFRIKGEVNASDIAFMRMLASCDSFPLASVDLSEARVTGAALSDSAFYQTHLTRMSLPKELSSIGKDAFGNCSLLTRLTAYSYTIPQTGERCFDGIDSTQLMVSVIVGSKEGYLADPQWSKVCHEGNTTEFGTLYQVYNKTRGYGKANPVFTVRHKGLKMSASPKPVCDATRLSPVGLYEVRLVLDSSVNTKNLVLIDGVLEITKAPLSITVADATRLFNEENPEFSFTYSGFKNDETEAVLSQLPSAVCEATASSPVGTYEIVVSGAEAENYEMQYTNGILTVVENPNSLETIEEEAGNELIFDLTGNRVSPSKLNPGLYIINGQKQIVR